MSGVSAVPTVNKDDSYLLTEILSSRSVTHFTDNRGKVLWPGVQIVYSGLNPDQTLDTSINLLRNIDKEVPEPDYPFCGVAEFGLVGRVGIIIGKGVRVDVRTTSPICHMREKISKDVENSCERVLIERAKLYGVNFGLIKVFVNHSTIPAFDSRTMMDERLKQRFASVSQMNSYAFALGYVDRSEVTPNVAEKGQELIEIDFPEQFSYDDIVEIIDAKPSDFGFRDQINYTGRELVDIQFEKELRDLEQGEPGDSTSSIDALVKLANRMRQRRLDSRKNQSRVTLPLQN